MPLQIRRGTDAERTAMTQPLAAGELIFVSNTNRLFIGNGTTLGGVPVTDYSDEQARDAAAAMFVAGTHNAISFVHDDTLDKINVTVNLSDYQGVIKAAAFNGSVVANDSSLLIDGNTGKFNLSGSVGTDIIPDTNLAYDLGSATYRFRDLYLSGSSIKLGAATITATGTAVNLPAGSTVGGSAIGIPGGDLNVNIVADDSTVIVNTTTEVVTAQGGFVGNVTGNINGVVTGTAGSSLVGNVTGSLVGDSTGYHTGDMKGSVFADDSSPLVDSVDRIFYGVIDTGNTIINSNSITALTTLDMGTLAVPLDLNLNLNSNLQLQHSIDGVTGKFISLTMRRGTLSSPAAVQAGDELGGVVFKAFSNTTTTAISGTIGFIVDSTAIIAGGSFIKSKAFISASTDTGAAEADSLILDSAGVATSNAFVASKYNQLAVYANDAARTTSIPTAAKGMMVFMTAGTSPTVTNKAVVYDGTNWVALH